ncbi:hypothetical protein OV090_13135 [Nannocystis sp. RBIL2]|uniref:hypothetical protein n=1 Tax=Nannocystis sp. RBIL2 TaxID=2996788 RepID=UPI00227214F1|nr:hypothetical protein [Nannocystis sp. RBIL2]MCY1065716.1 hypothetical protein [Nannocystis sp. RBIL2]
MYTEGTKGLRAVELWHAWGEILARGGDPGVLLSTISLRSPRTGRSRACGWG